MIETRENIDFCRQAYSGRQEKTFTQMAAAKASALAGASPEMQERISEAVGFAQTIPGLFSGPGELSLAAKAERALSAGEKWTLGAWKGEESIEAIAKRSAAAQAAREPSPTHFADKAIRDAEAKAAAAAEKGHGESILGKSRAERKGTEPSGADNIATGPKLKEQIKQEELDAIARQDPRLDKAVHGVGLHEIGSGTRAEADRLGKIWVGDGAKEMSKGKGWESFDGTRTYRFSKDKPTTPSHLNPTGTQANFERLEFNDIGKKVKVANGHMLITD